MSTFATTSYFSALLVIMLVALSVNVIRTRIKFQVALGDGEKPALRYAIRAQANFAEYTPWFLLLMAFAEAQKAIAPAWLMVMGSAFILGRISHAYSLLQVEQRTAGSHIRFRQVGMVTSFTCLLWLAFALLL